MRWPDFLIVGAAKAGTTALYHYMRQHPGLFMSPVREPNFFGLDRSPQSYCGPGDRDTIGRNSIVEEKAYLRLFEEAGADRLAGEVSPLYLYNPAAASRIHAADPAVKLIAILRNPADRAYASYLHLVRDGREPIPSFEEALEAESRRIDAGWEHLWHYRAMGYYAAQLERYERFFDAGQMRVVLYEDLKRQPLAVLQDCFSFLGVDPFFEPDLSRRPNRSGVPRSRWVQRVLSSTSPVKHALVGWMPERWRGMAVTRIQRANLRQPQLETNTRHLLLDVYRNDILRLEHMIDRDLSHWLSSVESNL